MKIVVFSDYRSPKRSILSVKLFYNPINVHFHLHGIYIEIIKNNNKWLTRC